MFTLNLLLIEYRLIKKLGEGSFSEVYKAQSVQSGQYFAIKCMKAHFDSMDQVFLICSTDLGLKFERNKSVAETFTLCPYYYTHWSAIVYILNHHTLVMNQQGD